VKVVWGHGGLLVDEDVKWFDCANSRAKKFSIWTEFLIYEVCNLMAALLRNFDNASVGAQETQINEWRLLCRGTLIVN
jgi:hypothetical protein